MQNTEKQGYEKSDLECCCSCSIPQLNILGVSQYTCNCASTNAFHRVRGSHVRLFVCVCCCFYTATWVATRCLWRILAKTMIMLDAKGRHVLRYLNNSIPSALMKIRVIQKDFVAECHLRLAITSYCFIWVL